MFVTIINDCRDDNAAARQVTRVGSLLAAPVSFIGVDAGKGASNPAADAAAAGSLIDVIDAALDHKSVVLVNVAPRGDRGKKWRNGTPFGYFTYKNTLVVATIDGHVLSLAKKLGLVDTIKHVDIPEVAAKMHEDGFIEKDVEEYLSKTQFRSFDFAPRLAAYILQNKEIPFEVLPIEEIPDLPQEVWWIDNFGNCKTTMLIDDLPGKPGEIVSTKFGEVKVYEKLKDVPDQETALIIGSSGLDSNRFVEFVIQGGSAAAKYDISIGDQIL
ncbi:MAG: SAM hydroxide adenosyltransferase [Patescibacteria group bacterium]